MDQIFGMKGRNANAHRVWETFLKSSSKALQNIPLRAFDEDFRNVEMSVSRVMLREGNVHRCSSGKVSTMSMPRAHPSPLPRGEGTASARFCFLDRPSGQSRAGFFKDAGNVKALSVCPSPAGAGEGGRRPGEGCQGKNILCGEGWVREDMNINQDSRRAQPEAFH